jgi:hypothetical protein
MGEAGDGSQDYLLEINPRITTSYVGLRRATSVNLLGVMLRAVERPPVAEIVWDRLPVQFTAEGTTGRAAGLIPAGPPGDVLLEEASTEAHLDRGLGLRGHRHFGMGPSG